METYWFLISEGKETLFEIMLIQKEVVPIIFSVSFSPSTNFFIQRKAIDFTESGVKIFHFQETVLLAAKSYFFRYVIFSAL